MLVANSLQSWANLYGVQSDPYVYGLMQALRDRKNLPMWATLDPLDYLPRAHVNTHKRMHVVALILTVLRNSLVFLPVALTWYAISKATSAFALYTSDNSLSVVNFLDFWENGYGVLSSQWALSNVATLDFQIILLIIGLTIAVIFIDRRLRNLKDRAIQEADSARIEMGLVLSTYLFDQQRVTNVTVNKSLARALRDVLNSTELLEKTSHELNKTVKAIPNNRELLTELRNIKSRIMQRVSE